MNKVENLKEITLKLEAGTSAESMDLDLDKSEFEFIFGIGPTGMTPFEYELVGKNEGQKVLLRLTKETSPVFFEHLHLPIMNLFDAGDELFLTAKILKIAPADHRQVVKAMADITAHDHGCDCGCGW